MGKNEIIFKGEKPQDSHEVCQLCGASYHRAGRARHRKTKKHRDCDYINNNIFEIKKIKDNINL